MKFADAVSLHKDTVKKIGYDSAYLVVAIALFIEESDVSALASEGLTEGSNDKKIDFIYHDKDSRRLIFAQGYISTKNVDSAPSNKASDLNTACAWLISGKIGNIPTKLKSIIQEFRAAIDANDIEVIDLLYVHNLPESVNVAQELHTTEEHLRAALANSTITVRSTELGRGKLDHLLSAQGSHIDIQDEIPFPFDIGIEQSTDKWSAAVSTVSGRWIYDLFNKYGDKLYSANYRGFLGSNGRRRVNSGIKDTAENSPSNFWAFNNGITVLTLKIEKTKSARPPNGIRLKGISVINGAQTTGSIGSVESSKVLSLEKLGLLCRVIECSDPETIDSIVRYNNTQNAITNWDRFSNDPDQRRIAEEFAEIGYSYSRKRGFSASGEQIGIEQVLQPLLAFHGLPTEAVRGKNQLFVQNRLYKNAFEDKKARHILFVYALARAVDHKRLTLKSKSEKEELIAIDEKQLALIRNLNFKPFLINVIANSLETTIGRKCDPLTVAFKPNAAKDSSTIELAARWAPVIDTILPLLSNCVDAETYFRKLSNEVDFVANIKKQIDAMLSAINQPEKFKTFSEMVSAS